MTKDRLDRSDRYAGSFLARRYQCCRKRGRQLCREKRMPHPKRSRWEHRTVRLFLALGLIFACAACVASRPLLQESTPEAQPTMPTVRVFIVVHRWHSGVVLPRAALAPAILPEVADFPHADYLEFGWGDRDYYEGKRGAWVILKAALWPRPGILHVASCNGRVVTCFPYSRIISLDLPDSALQRLSERLGGSFRRDAQPKAAPLGPGLYGESRFYPSREKFYVLKTCNAWTAGLLQAAGYPIRPASSLTVDALMKQLKPYGTLLQAQAGELARVAVRALAHFARAEGVARGTVRARSVGFYSDWDTGRRGVARGPAGPMQSGPDGKWRSDGAALPVYGNA
jgi:uncharacterized protein (TIGR02117 family)